MSARRRPAWLRSLALLLRGIWFSGRRFQCPCCGWHVRGFMERSGWSVRSNDGYCPRCNAKARHRRLWLFLHDHTEMFSGRPRVLEVGPAPVFATLFSRRKDLDYFSIGTNKDIPCQSVVADVKALPFTEQSFDLVLCQHVLEHVDDDKRAMAEICRVVKQDGWAVISVPLGAGEVTEEDPTLTDPAEQARRFGEIGHLRAYGSDIEDRLRVAGFDVSVDRADLLDEQTCARYGLRKDEHLFLCVRKSAVSSEHDSPSEALKTPASGCQLQSLPA